MCAAMRAEQDRKREAARAWAIGARQAREAGAIVERPKSGSEAAPQIIGYTWGKPLPPRSQAQIKRARANRLPRGAAKEQEVVNH